MIATATAKRVQRPSIDVVGDDQGDQDDARRLGEHTHEQHRVEVGRGVLEDLRETSRAGATLVVELLGARLGERRERGVDADQQTGDDGQDR